MLTGKGDSLLKVLSSRNAFQQLLESSLPGLLRTDRHTLTRMPVKRPRRASGAFETRCRRKIGLPTRRWLQFECRRDHKAGQTLRHKHTPPGIYTLLSEAPESERPTHTPKFIMHTCRHSLATTLHTLVLFSFDLRSFESF